MVKDSTIVVWLLLVSLCIANAEYKLYKDPNKPLNQRIKDLLGRMTLEEKIGQMMQIERAVASPQVMKDYYIGLHQLHSTLFHIKIMILFSQGVCWVVEGVVRALRRRLRNGWTWWTICRRPRCRLALGSRWSMGLMQFMAITLFTMPLFSLTTLALVPPGKTFRTLTITKIWQFIDNGEPLLILL